MSHHNPALLLCCLLSLAPAARADVRDDELVLRTRMEDGARAGRWPEVVAAFRDLRRCCPYVDEDARLLFLFAQACDEAGDDEAAVTALEALLELRPTHLLGLRRLAALRMDRGDPEEAKRLLLLFASHGGRALEELARDRARYGALLDQPSFVLECMRAGQAFVVPEEARHDLFRPPGGGCDCCSIRTRAAPDADEAGATELRALEVQLDALLEELTRLLETGDVEALIERARELVPLIARYEALGGAPRERLEAFRGRQAELAALIERARLLVDLQAGNALLRAMQGALQDHDHAAVFARAAELEALCERMRGEREPSFRRLADQLTERARPLVARARTLERVAGLRLDVTGIVVPPAGEPARAIIDDLIYAEGDAVLDPVSRDPVPGLVIVAITRSTVRLRCDDVELVRELRAAAD